MESAYGHPKIEFIQCDNTFITEKEIQNSRYHIKNVSNVEQSFRNFGNQEAEDYAKGVYQEEIERVRKDLKGKGED